MKPRYLVLLTLLIILTGDQVLKFWIKLNFAEGDGMSLIGNWAHLKFLENEGMAYGMTFGGKIGKVFLTLFRIFAVIAISYYIRLQIKAKASLGFIFALSLILAGAIGNIIDSLVYGLIFTTSEYQVAELVPFGQGYGSFLHGKVVDMLSLTLFDYRLPNFFPFIGGEHRTFFGAIFNVADSAITIGVTIILLFQRSFFKEELKEATTEAEVTA